MFEAKQYVFCLNVDGTTKRLHSFYVFRPGCTIRSVLFKKREGFLTNLDFRAWQLCESRACLCGRKATLEEEVEPQSSGAV